MVLPLNPDTDLAQRIKRYRHALRESQTEFGKRFKVGRLTVGSWEKGSHPNHEHLPQLIEQLEATETKPEQEKVYQFELPFEEVFDLAVKMSPQASQTIHFELRLRRKAS